MRTPLLFLLVAASGPAVAQESCRAPAPGPAYWTDGDLTSNNIRVTRDGASRAWYFRESADLGVSLSVRWVDSLQTWAQTASYRTEIRFAPSHGGIESITWMPLDRETQTFVPFQRDVRTYDERGALLTDTRQDFVEGAWIGNRRALFERREDGTLTAQRFERFRDGTWALDFEMRTEFDEAGNRTLCEHAAPVEGADSTRVYLQYVSSYDAEGRMTYQLIKDWRYGRYEVDSVAFGYGDDGLYRSFTEYGWSSDADSWVPDTRYLGRYDGERRLTETRVQRPGPIEGGVQTWRDARRYTFSYRSDGRLATRSLEDWDPSAGAWTPFYTFSYVTDTAVPAVPVPIPPPAAVRLGVGPNPFVAEATLTLDVPEAGPVRVEVFDARGRRVAVAFDGEMNAGTETLPLRLGDAPAGVYLVRATVGAEAATEAVTVVR